jgi:hypothetical protein
VSGESAERSVQELEKRGWSLVDAYRFVDAYRRAHRKEPGWLQAGVEAERLLTKYGETEVSL